MSAENQIFIGNLSCDPQYTPEGTECLLYELLSQCGPVLAVRVPSTDAGLLRGFAFAEMGSVAAATYASLALNGMKLNGRPIRVACAMENETKKSLKLEALPPSVDEVDLYEALSEKFATVRGVSMRRNREGRSEGKATVWFDNVEMADKVRELIANQVLCLDHIPLKLGTS